MDREKFLTRFLPLVGGKENTSLCEFQDETLYVTLKDVSLVELDAVRRLPEVTSAKLGRSRLTVCFGTSEKKEEVPFMANTKEKVDYSALAKQIIEKVGGKENIVSLRHCFTRLRFELKDESIAKDEEIQKLQGVISVLHGGGEYMIVIGNAVVDAYDAVMAQLGDLPSGNNSFQKTAAETKDKVKQNPVMKLLNLITGAIGPCLNFICAGGIIKGIVTLLEMSNIVPAGSGLDTLFSAAGDAIFYFLPIFLGMNLAKTLKGDQFLGAVIGAAMCYPSINGTDLTLFGFQFNYTYTNSFLPVIAVVAVAVPLAKLFRKVLPKAVSNFLTPAFTLMIVLPLGYAIIGPVVAGIGNIVNLGITNLMAVAPALAGIVFAASYQVMVLFGVHGALTSFAFMSLLEGNPDSIMAMGCLVCFAQIGVVLGIYFKTKDENLKSIALPAFFSGIFGITEPAIYGVTLPRIKYFILSCVGAALTGAIIMISGAKMYSFTGLGVFALLGMIDANHTNLLFPILAVVIPFAFSFIAAYILYSDKAENA